MTTATTKLLPKSGPHTQTPRTLRPVSPTPAEALDIEPGTVAGHTCTPVATESATGACFAMGGAGAPPAPAPACGEIAFIETIYAIAARTKQHWPDCTWPQAITLALAAEIELRRRERGRLNIVSAWPGHKNNGEGHER